MRHVRIVSFLGMGDLRDGAKPPYFVPTRHQFDEVLIDVETPLHDAATVLWLKKMYKEQITISLVLLGTKETKVRWIDSGLFVHKLSEVDALVDIKFILIGEGSSKEERWELFNSVVKSLDPNQIHEEACRPDEIIIDITNGYRAIPVFAITAILQRMAINRWNEQVIEPSLRIIYAAFKHNVDPTLVWDISQLIDVTNWTQSVDELMTHGRADRLSDLLVTKKKELWAKMGKDTPDFDLLRKCAVEFADSLVTVRLPALVKTASGALTMIVDKILPDLVQQLPPLVEPMSRLANLARSMSARDIISREGIIASANIGKHYLRLQRYSELAALIRETWVSLISMERFVPNTMIENTRVKEEVKEENQVYFGKNLLQPGSGSGSFDSERKRIDNTFSYETVCGKEVWGMQGMRNDMLHGGFRSQPVPANSLRKQVADNLKKLTDYVERMA